MSNGPPKKPFLENLFSFLFFAYTDLRYLCVLTRLVTIFFLCLFCLSQRKIVEQKEPGQSSNNTQQLYEVHNFTARPIL